MPNKQDLEIQVCATSDIAAVLELWRQSSSPGSTDTPEALRTRLKRDDGLFLLACDGGKIIGSLVAGWDGWRGYFYRLVIDTAWRRRRIATALVREGERRLYALGARRVCAAVLAHEEPAREFWRTVGYERSTHVMPFAKRLTGAD